MLRAYTSNAAWSLFQERSTGSLEPGKLADIVVLDSNFFERSLLEIVDSEVVFTFFEGRQVWPLA